MDQVGYAVVELCKVIVPTRGKYNYGIDGIAILLRDQLCRNDVKDTDEG